MPAAAHSTLTKYVDDIAAAINCDVPFLLKAFALAQTPFLCSKLRPSGVKPAAVQLIKNMSDAVYIDRFCLESSASYGQSTSGPGQTTTSTSNLSAGQELLNSLPVASGATVISVVAASSNNLPIKLALISPSGAVLQVADSTNGVAVISAPVTQSGTYIVKTVNLSLGPVQVWTAATPT